MAKNTKIVENTEEIKTEVTEVKEEKVIEKKDIRKLINKDTEVVIMNNTTGLFTYTCPKTHDPFEMSKYGDTDVMRIEHLTAMKNQHRGILENYWILPIAVEDENIEIEDVVKYLGLQSIYKDCVLSSDAVDNILLRTSIEKFESIMDSINTKFAERLAERGVILYKERKFVDLAKMKSMENKIGKENLFSEIELK